MDLLSVFGKVRYTSMWLLKFELDQLRELNDMVEAFLSSQLKSYSDHLDAATQSLSEEQRQKLWEFHQDKYSELRDDLPEIFRRSLLLHAYGSFEHNLASYCRTLQGDANLQLCKRRKPGASVSETSWAFLTKVAGFSGVRIKTWPKVTLIRKIRNKIAHEDGEVDANLGAVIKRHCPNVIEVRPRSSSALPGKIALQPGFITYVLNTLDEFAHEADHELEVLWKSLAGA